MEKEGLLKYRRFSHRTRESLRSPPERVISGHIGQLALAIWLLNPLVAFGDSVSLPHTFENGSVADADEVNDNFNEVSSAVNDNAARIVTLESQSGGLSGAYINELFATVHFDGGEPGNLDPREGTSDVDQDGLANFLDPDNDDDGLSDVDELGLGSDINLVTPIVSSLSPDNGQADDVTAVTVLGENFGAGLSVAFGSQAPAAYDITPSSFKVDVGPQPLGDVSVVVSLANGQSDSASFEFHRLRRVFSTSTLYTGNLGGIAGADAICAARAAAAGLSGTYKAWISDGTDSPSTIHSQNGIPYRTTTGAVVALDWGDLIDGSANGPRSDEFGDLVPVGYAVWTNTNFLGEAMVDSCSDWTSEAGSGRTGNPSITGPFWTSSSILSCSESHGLYCFEQ